MVFGKKTKNDSVEPSQWKKKYYDSLDDIEYKEEQWHQVEKILRNAIVRISLAVDDKHQRLAKLLNTLRDDIRNGKNSLNLKVQLDKIITVIRDLDSMDGSSSEPVYAARQLVDDCVNRVQWTERAQKFKRGLSRQFNTINDDEVQKFIFAFTKLINQELLWYEQEVKDTKDLTEKTEIVDEVKAKDNLQVTQRPENDIPKDNIIESKSIDEPLSEASRSEPKYNAQTLEANLDYPSLLLTLLRYIPNGCINATRIRQLQLKAVSSKTRDEAIKTIELIANEIGTAKESDTGFSESQSSEAVKLLIEFLELVSLPDDLSSEAESIRQILILEPNKLAECLNKTVEIVMLLQLQFKQERKEIEGFLKELSTRLREIDDEVKKVSGISENRYANVNKMTTNLSDVADNIEKAMNDEQSIENLKDSVKSHVIMIRHHMDTFLGEDKVQQGYSADVVQQLAKELLIVKQEADALREQLEKKRLQATHDTLTRIPNRLAYDEWIAQEYDRFIKYDTPFVLIVWDVDFFKRVNDEFGHQAGDKVLRVIAQMISENIRDADFVARYGGEEFVVVLPGTQQEAAMRVANTIRLAIEACAFHFRDKPVKVTASAGIAEIAANESVQMLFERADKALYKAKDSGRNICIIG